MLYCGTGVQSLRAWKFIATNRNPLNLFFLGRHTRSRRKEMRTSQRKGRYGTAALPRWNSVYSRQAHQSLGGTLEGRLDSGGWLSAPHTANPSVPTSLRQV